MRLLVLAAAAVLCVQTAGAAPQPLLRIIFPEGSSVRQMADQAAHVRRIVEREAAVPSERARSSRR
jgi:hypothetical protein